ncbi:MAG: UbiA family prenyltransferase [Candidatus Micrarchaeota archaeon]
MGSEKKMQFTGKLKAWLRLVRIEHAIISAFGVLVGLMLASKAGFDISMQNLAFALLVPIFVNIGAFAFNDYFDVEVDKENKRKERPLVSGELGENVAICTGIGGLALGSILGWMINFNAGVVASIFAILSLLYNWKLKDIAILGNLFVAISMAIAFLFGAVAAGMEFANIGYSVWILCAGATIAGFGREIIKTVQDMEGDRKVRGSKSLPHMIGKRNSLLLASACFILFCLTVPALVIYSDELNWNTLSLGLLGISFFAFLTMAYMVVAKKGEEVYERVRKISLISLGIALAAIILACI